MANTLNRNYPYPVPASDPDVPYWNQQLAEAVEEDVADVEAMFTLDYADGSGASVNSRYTRYKGNGGTGLVIAHIVVSTAGLVIPANNTAGLTVQAGAVPLGYRPPYTVGMLPAVLSGNGQGTAVQFVINVAGDILIRSGATGFTAPASTAVYADVPYRWDGTV